MTQSTTTLSPDLGALKEVQHKVWSSGDYGRIAWVTVPVADDLVAAMELSPGSSVLDVATGTGHVALSSARAFCDATGIDYVPAESREPIRPTAPSAAAASSPPPRREPTDAHNH